MENKKIDNTNIFDSVVLESNSNKEAVLVVKVVILITPISEDDLKGSRLNQ